MASHRKFCKKWLYLLFEANHFPCVCLLGKSRLTSGHENVIHVTSGNLDDFKIIQISNMSVSFVEKISMSMVTVFKATSIYHDASIRPYKSQFYFRFEHLTA